jgi:hypothetical protein
VTAVRARRSRAAVAISGSLGLFALGLAGPLGVGSARDGSGAAAPRRVVPIAPHASVDPTLGACPIGSSALGVLELGAPSDLRVCHLEGTRTSTCAEEDEAELRVALGGRGNGTRAHPFGSLDAALAAAPAGATIVLAPGAHAAPQRAIEHVHVRGACEGGARLVGSLRIGEGGSLSSLEIEGTISMEGHGTLTDLAVQGEPALRLEGARAHGSLERVVLRADADAIVASLGARLDGDVLRVEGGGQTIRAEGAGTLVRLTHLEVGAGPRARSLLVSDRARVVVRASVLAAGREDAVAVEHAELELEQTALVGPSRRLLDLRAGTHARLSQVALHDAREQALLASDAVVEIHGLVVRSHRGASEATSEAAVLAENGAQVVLEDGVVHGARGHAVLATGRGTWLRGERLELLHTHAAACATTIAGCSGAPRGHAIASTGGARVELSGSQIGESDGCGLFVDGPSSRAAIDSSLLRDNRVALCGDGASGDWLALARDVRLEDNESVLARPRPR